MWPSTASAAGHLERWSIASGEILTPGPLGTVLGGVRENPDVILPQKCPLLWGYLDPYLIRNPLGPPDSIFKTASQSLQPFLQS